MGAQLRCRVHARDISLSLSAATDDSILNRVTAQIEALAPRQRLAMCWCG